MAGKGSVLLPKSEKDFARKEFWEKFFKNRGSKSFEWYGEYTTLCSVLHKYIKIKDKLLIVGCGNSSLGADLYDTVNCQNITSIDNSAVAIRQMIQKNKRSRPEMEFLQMDATTLSDFASSSFSCALDKATLDAIYSNEDQRETAEKMLLEVGRVLSVGGRYIIISLAQEHILNLICSFFTRQGSGWLIRVLVVPQAPDSDLQLPVFTFVFTKCISNPRLPLIIEVQNPGSEKLTRLGNVDELSGWVSDLQEAAIACQSVTPEKECRLTFQNHLGQTTYTCFLMESRKSSNLPFAVFVVPFGKHSDETFSSPAARRDILEAVTAKRLLLVMLHPSVYYESQEAVKASLSRVVMRYAPRRSDLAIRESDVQILSSEDIYPSRLIDDERSGDFGVLVEQIDGWGRRLIHLNSSGHFTISWRGIDRAAAHVKLLTELLSTDKGKILTGGSNPIFLEGEATCYLNVPSDVQQKMRESFKEEMKNVQFLSDIETDEKFEIIIWRGGEPLDRLRHLLAANGLLIITGIGLEAWDKPKISYQVIEPGLDVSTDINVCSDNISYVCERVAAVGRDTQQLEKDKEKKEILTEIRRSIVEK